MSKKKSRKERKAETQRTLKQRAARAAAMVVAAAVIAVATPTAAMVKVDEPTSTFEAEVATAVEHDAAPISGIVPVVTIVEDEPALGIVSVENKVEAEVIPLRAAENDEKFDDEPMTVHRIDTERRLDFAIRDCFARGRITFEQLMSVAYCITLSDLLERTYWPRDVIAKLHVIGGITIFSRIGFPKSGNEYVPLSSLYRPTVAGEEIWQLFRRRINRQGAQYRIAENTIIGQRRLNEDRSYREAQRRPHCQAA